MHHRLDRNRHWLQANNSMSIHRQSRCYLLDWFIIILFFNFSYYLLLKVAVDSAEGLLDAQQYTALVG